MSKTNRQAGFTKWMGPILDCLRQLGGSAKPKQVSEWIANQLSIPEVQLEAKMKSGTERFHNQVCWARQYLVWEGLLDGSKRGEWKLTDLGAKTRLTEVESRKLFLKWVDIHRRAREESGQPREKLAPIEPENDTSPCETEEADEEELLGVIQGLPPDGFERLCKRLLHEWGFQAIQVLGKSHDGGVDGIAILQLNPFVSFDVAFQCKRYRGGVSRDQVASFRGSKKAQHADKLIFITTGYFTQDAKKEAKGEGAMAVELVDGERLVSLFEDKQLGLRREEVFKVDHAFFDQFRQLPQ
jgi:restriction system protein